VMIGHRHGECAGCHGCATAIGAIFEHHHLRRRNGQAVGRQLVDFRVRFAAMDVRSGEDKPEPLLKAEPR
jgi:hypothetical protein